VRASDRGRVPLPAGLPSAEREFFEQLRRMADLAGLSQRVLEKLTAAAGPSAYYSRSQWARALKGQARPPLQAVRVLSAQLGDGFGAEALPDLWVRAFAGTPPSRPRRWSGTGPRGSMPAAEAEREEQNGRLLRKAREEFPEWDFHEVFGGWEAVPDSTPVVRAMDLGSLMEKLAGHDESRR
jgi:hypothetical protein